MEKQRQVNNVGQPQSIRRKRKIRDQRRRIFSFGTWIYFLIFFSIIFSDGIARISRDGVWKPDRSGILPITNRSRGWWRPIDNLSSISLSLNNSTPSTTTAWLISQKKIKKKKKGPQFPPDQFSLWRARRSRKKRKGDFAFFFLLACSFFVVVAVVDTYGAACFCFFFTTDDEMAFYFLPHYFLAMKGRARGDPRRWR